MVRTFLVTDTELEQLVNHWSMTQVDFSSIEKQLNKVKQNKSIEDVIADVHHTAKILSDPDYPD